jgi:SAM-dependent methyltransferase
MIFEYFLKGRRYIKRFGLLGALKCLINRGLLIPIGLWFGLDKWHVNSPYSCRPYKRLVVDLADSIQVNSVVEIGCGLGDIIARVKSPFRAGIDIDSNVIRAAKFINPNIDFRVRDCVYSNEIKKGSLVIMVNWIHNINESELSLIIKRLLPNVHYLILDKIDVDNVNSYKFKHNFNFMRNLFDEVGVVSDKVERRTFVLFKVRVEGVYGC